MRALGSMCILVVACSSSSGSEPIDADHSDTIQDAIEVEDSDDLEADASDEPDDVRLCPAAEPASGCVDASAETTCRVEVGRGRCDLAVLGDGFIVLADEAGGQRHVTAATMTIGGEGWLAAPGALYWIGTSADGDGAPGGDVGRIGVLDPLPAVVTTRVTLRVNLDPAAPIQTFLSGSAGETSSFETTMRVWDGAGVGHDLRVHFSRAAERRWIWNATTTLGELDGSVSLQVTVAYSGTLEFDEAGALATSTPGFTSARFHGAGPTPIDFDFGVGPGGSTSIAGPSTRTSGTQDGAGSALVSHVVIDEAGLVTQGSADGRTRVVGRLALSRFASPCALAAAGTGAWTETFHSGPPELGPPGEDGRGTIDICR